MTNSDFFARNRDFWAKVAKVAAPSPTFVKKCDKDDDFKNQKVMWSRKLFVVFYVFVLNP